MNTDARLSTSFPQHPKTLKLRRRLGDAGPLGVIYLILWTGRNRSNGDLSGMSDEDLELAADWRGEVGALIREAADVGFLEGESGARRIHDWAVHNPWAAGAHRRSEASRKAACAKHGIAYEPHAGRTENDAERMRGAPINDGAAQNRTAPSPSPLPIPKEAKDKNARKRAIPTNFEISESVRSWALENRFGQLERRLEHFVGLAKAKGYKYADWDAALRNAIRDDWAKLNGTTKRPEHPTISAKDIFNDAR